MTRNNGQVAPPLKVSLLGAESTGKTTLAQALAARLRARGQTVAVVDEVLRAWCQAAGRTPRPEEQLPIAQEQERRVDAAAASGVDIVIADTTAVMVAVYSAMLFADGSLVRFASERQRGYDLTLLTALDIPWVADGLQRDGPHVRAPVDAQVRQLLLQAGVAWKVVYGSGDERVGNALSAIDSIAAERLLTPGNGQKDPETAPTRWFCATCGDAACEHRLFRALKAGRADAPAPAAGATAPPR